MKRKEKEKKKEEKNLTNSVENREENGTRPRFAENSREFAKIGRDDCRQTSSSSHDRSHLFESGNCNSCP